MNNETKQSEPDVLELMAEKHAEQERLAQQAGLDQCVSRLREVCQKIAQRLSSQREHALRLDPTIAFCVGAILVAADGFRNVEKDESDEC